jgi:hypothetical protein
MSEPSKKPTKDKVAMHMPEATKIKICTEAQMIAGSF